MNEEFLRNQLFFSGLSDEDIAWLLSMAETIPVKKGERVIEEGTQGDALFYIVEGQVKVTKRVGNNEVVVAQRGEGEVMGEMSLIDESPRNASVYASTDGRMIKIHKDVFLELISTRPAATLSILRTVISRLRNNEALLQQNEKMAALGTLAAGLAHELNNPAAAAQRASDQLQQVLSNWQQLTLELGTLGLESDQVELLRSLDQELLNQKASLAPQDPLERSDREQELETWLEDQGVDNAWEVAPVLVEMDWDTARLETYQAQFNPAQFTAFVRWICTGRTIYTLLVEVNMGAGRVAEIVKAVKSYSFLDQAPMQQVDLHAGLEDTLIILRSKLRQGIQIVREYDPQLPIIEAYGSELNQVWTNIIDNAVYAMGGKGELRLKTYKEEDTVVLEITDSGAGIPADVQSRIFEPFYTTKPPGAGSGLGLNISYNIIKKHGGEVRVNSRPGQTTFKVSLPIAGPGAE